jgi:hypothetical protein
MGFRFRRSIRLLPGLRLNVGKRGASVSIGGRGAHVTVSPTYVTTSAGIPGSGLSLRETHRITHGNSPGAAHSAPATLPLEKTDARSRHGAVLRIIVFLTMLAIIARVVWLLVR